MRTFMTRDERKADAIAKQLVKIFRQIEEFNCDPEMVMDSAIVQAVSEKQGVKDAIVHLKKYYSGEYE